MEKNISHQFIPIVLCAGFGTRLSPLTKFIPKVACPILNKPIAFLNIEQLFHAGFEKVYCNTHYLADTVRQELTSAASHFGYDPKRIVFLNEDEILETGGGIARIYHELAKQEVQNATKDLLVVSGDLVSEFPIQKMIDIWKKKKTDEVALMCTRRLVTPRRDMTWVSSDLNHVIGFGEKYAQQAQNQNAISRLFSNHQIISHHIVKSCKVEKRQSVDMFFQSALNNNQKIIHYEIPESKHWFNVGTVPEYLDCLYFFDKQNQDGKRKFIVNYAYHTPVTLKEKIDHYVSSHKENITPPADSIVISFLDIHQKGTIFIPMANIIKETEHQSDARNFYFCI